jgi:hypothetical protein
MFATAVAVGLCLAGISDAQAQGITLGVQGGYNYAQLSDAPTDIGEIGDKGGLVLGAFVDIGFSGMWFVSVEGNYAEMKSEATSGGTTEEFKQNFIQIPVYLGVKLLSGMIQPVFYAGGTASFETTCEITPEGGSAEACDAVGNEINTKSAIWGAVFGGGLNVALGPVIINGDVRYNLGLTKIADNQDTKWNNWMFLVGVGFGLGM